MNDLEFEQQLLRDEAKFIESYPVTQAGDHIDLEFWQREYIRDPSSMKITNKSRRTGFTFVESAKGLYRSQNIIRDSMPYVYEKHFISRNLIEAQDMIVVARWIYDCLPTHRRLAMVSETKRELIFEDYKGRRTRLRAHTSNDPRGIGGDIAFDEAAF